MKTNWLAHIFDWTGEVFERFTPSAFRFLAAVLPYLTPVPVAWLTADSAAKFLNFPAGIAAVFVFALEGIGLWFTTLFVDSVVDWVRSRNVKTFAVVLMFAVTVAAYVMLLVDLNVTLERAVGQTNPAISRVITLLCFLPLLTGVGNGYYKLKLEYKTEVQLAKQHDMEIRERVREEARQDRMERFRIKHSSSRSNGSSSGSKTEFRNSSRTRNGTSINSSGSNGTSSRIGRHPVHQERVFSYLEKKTEVLGRPPTFTEVMDSLKLSPSTVSRLRNEWLAQNR